MKKSCFEMLQAICVVCFFTFVFASSASAQTHTPRYVSMAATTKGYYEYLPQGYSTETQNYSLIVFLHGMGQMGDGSSSQLPRLLQCALPYYINKGLFPASFAVNGETQKFIVVSPQFSKWPTAADIDNIITYSINKYRVNVNRIYVTGLSMGGGVTWEYVGNNSTYAGKVAAIVPICGASYPNTTRAKIIATSNLPVWATHNDGDPTAPVSYTNNYVSYINSFAPSFSATKSIFSSTSHDAWTKTYDPNYKVNNKNIYEWMLQYKRTSPTTVATNSTTITSTTTAATTTTTSISAAVTANSPVCAGSTLNLSATAVSGATYKWSGPNGFASTAQSPSISSATSAAAGTYTVSVTVSGKVYTASTTVSVTAAQTYYKDYDKDGYGGTTKVLACSAPSGYVLKSGDCNDSNAAVHPGATELANGVDDDCDGQVDEGLSTVDTTTTTAITTAVASATTVITSTDSTSSTASSITTTSLGKFEAESYSAQTGINVGYNTSISTSKYIYNLHAGDKLDYTINVPTAGTYTITYRVLSKSGTDHFQLTVGGKALHTLSIPNSMYWNQWKTLSKTVYLNAGAQILRIAALNDDWIIDYFEIAGTTSSARVMSDSAAANTDGVTAAKAAVLRMVVSANTIEQQFKVNLQGDASKGTVSVKVRDGKGNLVEEESDVAIGQTLVLSGGYAAGTYFIEAIQGTQRTTAYVKL